MDFCMYFKYSFCTNSFSKAIIAYFMLINIIMYDSLALLVQWAFITYYLYFIVSLVCPHGTL